MYMLLAMYDIQEIYRMPIVILYIAWQFSAKFHIIIYFALACCEMPSHFIQCLRLLGQSININRINANLFIDKKYSKREYIYLNLLIMPLGHCEMFQYNLIHPFLFFISLHIYVVSWHSIGC